MGFMDKAKAAATDFAAKAETAINQAGGAGQSSLDKNVDQLYRDLGMLTYLESTGRSIDPADRTRLIESLQTAEGSGAISSFALSTAPPPPPGAVAAGTAAAPPPPSAGNAEGTGGAGAAISGGSAVGGGSAAVPPPPPPPPSWG